jgi:hypothetical protein
LRSGLAKRDPFAPLCQAMRECHAEHSAADYGPVLCVLM